MNVIETKIPGVLIVETDVFGDHRGYFTETYSKPKYEKLGITVDFVQDNMSFSAQKGTLRGLHWQNPPYAQSKLVSCTKGKVIDVAVDIRKGSPTFGEWASVELSAENHRQFFIPQGFAHGFCVLSDLAVFAYKCTDFYHPEDEGGLMWNDKNIGIDWEKIMPGITENANLSEKDKNHPAFCLENKYFDLNGKWIS